MSPQGAGKQRATELAPRAALCATIGGCSGEGRGFSGHKALPALRATRALGLERCRRWGGASPPLLAFWAQMGLIKLGCERG